MNTAVTDKVCQLREKVSDLIGPSRYRTWFRDTTEFRIDGATIGVTVANEFVGNWIASNYMSQLREASKEVIGPGAEIDLRIARHAIQNPHPRPANGSQNPVQHKPKPQVSAPQRQASPKLRGDLQTFVVGASNQLAYSAASTLVRSPDHGFSPLVIHGGCGLGKTHLLQGICNGVSRSHPTLGWCYVSGEEFTNEFIYAVKSGRVDAFRARFRNVDLLVIDDIHFLANKKATQEEFLHTFNAIDACGKAVVLSSDRHPRSIATLSEPLINRLIAGMVVEIQPPDLQTRKEILARRASLMRATIPPDVIEFLVNHVTRNVRELEGVLYKLVALASLAGEPINSNLAQLAVEDYVGRTRSPEANEIERTCAQYFGVTVEAIRSKGRERTISLARAIAMYLIRKHTPLSFPEIGRLMGKKNHSTVLMAVRRIENVLHHNQTVEWRTASGVQEMSLQTVLEELECRLRDGA